ncbi:Pre-mRNA-splicing factor Syf1-like N-terminal HAT-repeats domain-containing protein [Entamoeba marina]
MDDVDNAIIEMRRFELEREIQDDDAYDAWFDYIQMEINEAKSVENTRELYERVIAQIPKENEKDAWRRYVEFWVLYARFEEKLEMYERCYDIYQLLMKIIPHNIFTFKKIWRAYANFAKRRNNIGLVRKIYGNAIGWCHRDEIFEDYIEFETKNNEQERVDKIKEKWDYWKNIHNQNVNDSLDNQIKYENKSVENDSLMDQNNDLSRDDNLDDDLYADELDRD